jgi:hypothetical protein
LAELGDPESVADHFLRPRCPGDEARGTAVAELEERASTMTGD